MRDFDHDLSQVQYYRDRVEEAHPTESHTGGRADHLSAGRNPGKLPQWRAMKYGARTLLERWMVREP